MFSRSSMLAFLFILLQGFAALGLLGTSVHGVAGQAISAPIYFMVAAGLTMWTSRKWGSAMAVAGIGTLLLAAAPGVIAVLGFAEEHATKRRIADTRIADVRDEPIVSPSGRIIGVRLTYTVTVPGRGYFSILPRLGPRYTQNDDLRLDSRRWTLDGRRESVQFDGRKTHTMVVDLYPHILFVLQPRACVQSATSLALADSSAAAPLRVEISESTYGNTYHGGQERWTRGAYDLAGLYRAVLAEGVPPCRTPG